MTPDFLRRRNALWARLRSLPPSAPEFGTALADLADLTGWDRTRILAGLGFHDELGPRGSDLPPGERP